MLTSAQQRDDSLERNKRVAIARQRDGIGSKPASIPEISRAPKPSRKGSCVRRRAGQERSIKKVIAALFQKARDLQAKHRAEARADAAKRHAAYAKRHSPCDKAQEAAAEGGV